MKLQNKNTGLFFKANGRGFDEAHMDFATDVKTMADVAFIRATWGDNFEIVYDRQRADFPKQAGMVLSYHGNLVQVVDALGYLVRVRALGDDASETFSVHPEHLMVPNLSDFEAILKERALLGDLEQEAHAGSK